MTNAIANRRNLILTALTGAATAAFSAPSRAQTAIPMPATIHNWMSWEGGVDLVGLTDPGLNQANVIVHLARNVHTPVGSAPSGLVFYQPDPKAAPLVMGFVSTSARIGAYFGPKIFAGTPFETAPVLKAKITITEAHAPNQVSSKLVVGKHVFEVVFDDLGALNPVDRAPGPMPFYQKGIEASAGKVSLKVDGKLINLIVPPIGLSGGPAAVWAPTGLFAR